MGDRKENTTAYKLRKCRENCGLSQKVVADTLGVERTTYTYYENGRSQPSLTTLVKLADIFSVDPSSLLPLESNTSVKENDTAQPHPIYSLKKDEHRLLLGYRMLSREQKDEVLDIITNMPKSNV